MGCRSDYMEQSGKEKLLQETARLYAFALMHLGKAVPEEVASAARTYYCKEDFVPHLCELLRSLDTQTLDTLVYDGKNQDSRKLADWWEAHQEADRKVAELEQKKKAGKLAEKLASKIQERLDQEKKISEGKSEKEAKLLNAFKKEVDELIAKLPSDMEKLLDGTLKDKQESYLYFRAKDSIFIVDFKWVFLNDFCYSISHSLEMANIDESSIKIEHISNSRFLPYWSYLWGSFREFAQTNGFKDIILTSNSVGITSWPEIHFKV